MGAGGKVVQFGFRAFTAALGLATVYMTVTFSVNVYRGISWHNAQTAEMKKEASHGQER